MRRLIVASVALLLIAVPSITQSPTPTPSLEETVDFIRKKVNSAFSYGEPGDENKEFYRFSKYEVGKLMGTQVFFSVNHWGKGMNGPWSCKIEGYLPLDKMHEVTIQPYLDSWSFTIIYENNSIRWTKTGACRSAEQEITRIYKSDEETAKRVAKAFEHAIKLTKEMGKKEAF